MKVKHLYLVLAIVGIVVPYYFLISFLTVHGVDGRAFMQQLFGTQISTFFAVDLLLSSVVFVIFLRHEARRYSIKHWRLYLVLCHGEFLSLAP